MNLLSLHQMGPFLAGRQRPESSGWVVNDLFCVCEASTHKHRADSSSIARKQLVMAVESPVYLTS